MDYLTFLERIINEGIEAAKIDYTAEKDKQKLEGSIAGFNACRNKTPIELFEVYRESVEYVNKEYFEHRDGHKEYWWFRCYQLEVEWVCNVVSAMLYNQGEQPILSWLPTCNGMNKAASIIGVNQTKN